MCIRDSPNIIGIKESSGDVEKVRRMAETTRHIKRTATVTETFAAVTPRMLKPVAMNFANGQALELVQVAALTGTKSAHVGTDALVRPAEQSSAPLNPPTIPAFKTRQKEVGFQILVGSAQKLHPSLEAGAVGAILAFACPAPTACYETYAAWKEGDQELARVKQERIAATAARTVGDLGIPALKYAMELNGYYGGPARLPLLPLTADQKAEVEQLMADIRN